MEPYPDPFIGGYALPNLVEVDLRRDMPVTEILAEPEPEPEIEPEPEPEPEPQPEPEPVQEPLQIPLPGVMPVMPPLITEYIPVGKIIFQYYCTYLFSFSKENRRIYKIWTSLDLYPHSFHNHRCRR